MFTWIPLLGWPVFVVVQEVFAHIQKEQVEKTGLLMTRIGPNARMKKWRKRFFVLASGCGTEGAGSKLTAYEDEKGEKCMAESDLVEATVDPQGHSSKMGLSFNIHLASGAKLELAAEEAPDKQAWISAIELALASGVAVREIEIGIGVGSGVAAAPATPGDMHVPTRRGSSTPLASPVLQTKTVSARSFLTAVATTADSAATGGGAEPRARRAGAVGSQASLRQLDLTFSGENPMPTPADQMFAAGDEFGARERASERRARADRRGLGLGDKGASRFGTRC